MKPETEKAILARSTEEKQEIIALLAKHMDSDLFVGALLNDDSTEELSEHGADIWAVLDELVDKPDAILSDDDASRLHDAICEGRRNDAIHILRDITGEFYRDVEAQNNLFPDRVPSGKDFAAKLAEF